MNITKLTRFLPVAVFAAIGSLLILGFTIPNGEVGVGHLDRPFPPFDQPAMLGTDAGISTGDIAGEVSLVNVFASWCGACRREHPKLMQISGEKNVRLYGINWKDRPGAGKVFLNRFGNPYRKTGDDADGKLGRKLGVTGVPETYLVDRSGRIRYRHIGPIDDQTWSAVIKPMITRLEAKQ